MNVHICTLLVISVRLQSDHSPSSPPCMTAMPVLNTFFIPSTTRSIPSAKAKGTIYIPDIDVSQSPLVLGSPLYQ